MTFLVPSGEKYTIHTTLFDLDMKTGGSLLDVLTRACYVAKKKEMKTFFFFFKINKSIFKKTRREKRYILLFMNDIKNDQYIFGLIICFTSLVNMHE